MLKVNFTYQTVTPESAAIGDVAEHGWIMPGMWEYPLQDDSGHHESVLDQAQKGDFDITDLAEAINFAESLGIYYDSGNWLDSVDPDIDYQSGEETTYSMHIEGVTPSTYNRIVAYLNN